MRSPSPRALRRHDSSAWTSSLAKAKETGKFDYDAPVEGLQVVDKYTLKLKLNYPWWDILAELTGAPAPGRSRARWSRPTATRAAG